MQIGLPLELHEQIYQYLDPLDLSTCSLVCKEWSDVISNPRFKRVYFRSLLPECINRLPFSFFRSHCDQFQFEQLFHLNLHKFNRYELETVAETDENCRNLRITKLLASLNLFKQAVKANANTYIDHWDASNKEYHQKFNESLEYIHILLLAVAYPDVFNIKNVSPRSLKLISWTELTALSCFIQLNNIAPIVEHDFIGVTNLDRELAENILLTLFKSSKIVHVIDPRGKGKWINLPNIILKTLFSSIDYKLIKSPIIPIFIKKSEQVDILEDLAEQSLIEIDRIDCYTSSGNINLDHKIEKIKFMFVTLGNNPKPPDEGVSESP